MGPAAISAQPQLEQMLGNEPDLTLYFAFDLLRGFGLQASNSAPIVACFFSATNETVRYRALGTFSAIIPPKSPDAARLIEAIEQRHIRAAQGLPVLFRLQIDFAKLLPVLGDELCSRGNLHSDALATCQQLRLQRKVLVPRFADAMKDPDPRFRAELLQEIRKDLIGDATSALDGVIAALNDPFSYVRAEAVKTLVEIHPRGEQLEALRQLLLSKQNDENEYVAETIQSSLKMLDLIMEERSGNADPVLRGN
jgi:hypothetical protein